jgi:hypothetical protein
VDTTRTGSGSLPASKEHGRTFRRNEIAKTRSALAPISIAHATWSNGSSTRSSNVGASRPDTTNSRPTIWRSSNSHQSGFGCALMSPRSNYRTRLETMSEAESTALAVREVYSAYYSEMGGVGAAPEPKARTPTTEGKVVRSQRPPRPQPGQSAARHSTRPMTRKSLPALLIFASMVALVVAFGFLAQ